MDQEEKWLRDKAAIEDDSFVSVAPSPELKAVVEGAASSVKPLFAVRQFTSRPPGFYHGAD